MPSSIGLHLESDASGVTWRRSIFDSSTEGFSVQPTSIADPTASVPPAPGRRVTKRRGETRQRMLSAAYEVFAEAGFGRTKPEMICERAGYTRGAFYSQFSSMNELFLILWAQRSQQLLADINAVLDAEPIAQIHDPREAVDHVLRAVPMDEKWFRINSEFNAHAQRDPELRRIVVAQEKENLAALLPAIETLLHRAGRTIIDRDELGQALAAVEDGTAIQCMMEPDRADLRERRAKLFLHVVLAYTAEVDSSR
ncbi:TetR/AcrR family transcriptional regulator [Nocardia sp. NPDC058058]|uniref:TetR/AcrR family transcriptional regulator n=1 Tax=Nocardia sp. NPDC058058 TaxID=3346317 RepID=UPI0036D90D4F